MAKINSYSFMLKTWFAFFNGRPAIKACIRRTASAVMIFFIFSSYLSNASVAALAKEAVDSKLLVVSFKAAKSEESKYHS